MLRLLIRFRPWLFGRGPGVDAEVWDVAEVRRWLPQPTEDFATKFGVNAVWRARGDEERARILGEARGFPELVGAGLKFAAHEFATGAYDGGANARCSTSSSGRRPGSVASWRSRCCMRFVKPGRPPPPSRRTWAGCGSTVRCGSWRISSTTARGRLQKLRTLLVERSRQATGRVEGTSKGQGAAAVPHRHSTAANSMVVPASP